MVMSPTGFSDDDLELLKTYETPFWGVLFSVSLMGITVMQSWTYFNAKYSEPFLRAYVTIIVALDLSNVLIDSLTLRYYFIENYGNPDAFRSLPSYMSIESIITTIIVFLVHLFFAYRVYLLTRKNWIATAFVVALATIAFVAGILKSVSSLYNPEIEHLSIKSMEIEVILRAVSAALCDIGVTVILYWMLREGHASTVVRSTRNVIERLLIFVMTRGVLVSLTQTALLILYAFNAEKLYWSILHFSLTRVYVISMVSMLNARQDLRNMLHTVHTTNDLEFAAYLRPTSVASPGPPMTANPQGGDLELGSPRVVREKESLQPSATETLGITTSVISSVSSNSLRSCDQAVAQS